MIYLWLLRGLSILSILVWLWVLRRLARSLAGANGHSPTVRLLQTLSTLSLVQALLLLPPAFTYDHVPSDRLMTYAGLLGLRLAGIAEALALHRWHSRLLGRGH